jgi:hypothetical protein
MKKIILPARISSLYLPVVVRLNKLSRRRFFALMVVFVAAVCALFYVAYALLSPKPAPSGVTEFAFYEDKEATAMPVSIDAEDNLPYIQAGREEVPTNAKYDSLGRPLGRVWYTYAEWKGDHLQGKQKRAFHQYKAAHIRQWIKAHAPLAKELGRQHNIPPALILGQAAMESMWGQSKVAKCASNFFGHKWSAKWKGKPGIVGFVNAKDDDPDDVFMHYETAWWAFRNHVNILNGYRERYGKSPKTVREWGKCLCSGSVRYATACNKDYAGNLESMVATLKKFGYDE